MTCSPAATLHALTCRGRFKEQSLTVSFSLVIIVNLACAIYASLYARGMYADAGALMIFIYDLQWFLASGTRAAVDLIRQAPVVLLTRETSATLFECAQLFTFTMLALPTLLCALCWWIAPSNRRIWALFPATYLLVGFAATSMHAVGEAAIATSYYWILLFFLLFRAKSARQQIVFLLLCAPAFWLHEATFMLTGVLLLATVARVHAAVNSRFDHPFSWAVLFMLAVLFVYQIFYVVYPVHPDDRAHILQGLISFEFIYANRHLNLPFVTGVVGLLFLLLVNLTNGSRPLLYAWFLFVLAVMLASVAFEQSFSPFGQLQARYHPLMTSTALGALMIVLIRGRLPESRCMKNGTISILISLCLAQGLADVVATRRWNAYVTDLQSRLVSGRGLIRWETTLHTGNEIADTNWRLFEIGWVIPSLCVVFSANGVVQTMIDAPKGTTFRPLDPEVPNQLPQLRGIDFTPYQSSFRLK